MIHIYQVTGSEVQDDRDYDPGMDDHVFLQKKAASHAARGWTVKWTGPDTFSATKRRWAGKLQCKRTFTVI